MKVSEETATVTFEEAMEQLETIVERLEEGDVPLEEAITIYKKGMELSKLCHDKLRNVEEQLTEILTADGHKETFSIPEEE
jgi:exodeoxyribonuclease VII small subunit